MNKSLDYKLAPIFFNTSSPRNNIYSDQLIVLVQRLLNQKHMLKEGKESVKLQYTSSRSQIYPSECIKHIINFTSMLVYENSAPKGELNVLLSCLIEVMHAPSVPSVLSSP